MKELTITPEFFIANRNTHPAIVDALKFVTNEDFSVKLLALTNELNLDETESLTLQISLALAIQASLLELVSGIVHKDELTALVGRMTSSYPQYAGLLHEVVDNCGSDSHPRLTSQARNVILNVRLPDEYAPTLTAIYLQDVAPEIVKEVASRLSPTELYYMDIMTGGRFRRVVKVDNEGIPSPFDLGVIELTATVDIKGGMVTVDISDSEMIRTLLKNGEGALMLSIGDGMDPVALSNAESPTEVTDEVVTFKVDFNKEIDLSDEGAIALALDVHETSTVYSSETPLTPYTDSVSFSLVVPVR